MRAALAACLIVTSAGATPAEVSFLDWPVACTPGRTCYIEDYMDRDPGPDARDWTCGLRTRDDHGGTDIALLSEAAMDAGVAVLAAADGVVAAIRDGVADQPVTPETRDALTGQECGNAVRIVHDNGYQTLYCHMQNGSIGVAPGQPVRVGDRLGLVGMSGLTNYPHLHFGVLDGNADRVDPFRPSADTCGMDGPTLWRDPVPYDPAQIYAAGFSISVPEFAAVRSGAARVATASPADALVLYGRVVDAVHGDVVTLRIEGPESQVFQHAVPLDAPKKDLFRAFGRAAPPGGWPPGRYRGLVLLMRDTTVLAVRHADIVVE